MSATDYFIGELYRTKALRWISVGNKKLTSRIRRSRPALRRLGPFWRGPNILCMWGRDASIGLCDKGVKPAIARPSAFALLRAWVPRCRVLRLLCFGRMRPLLRLCFAPLLLASPTHVALSISRPIAEFEHVFSFASGFIRADLHKHDTVQSSNNNHKILWSVCAIIETSKPGFSQGKTQAMLSLGRDEGPDNARVWGI